MFLSNSDAYDNAVATILKNFEKSSNFLEKDGSRIEVSCDKSVKYVRFWKIHIYFERGYAAASSYTKSC